MKDIIYTPEVTEPEGGNVDVEDENGDGKHTYGEEVTITVTPEPGMEVEDVAVTDEDGNTVEVTPNEDGTYTYEQPAGEVKVEVTMKEIEYENEIPEVSGGKVETSDENPTMGDEVTITVKPDGGKEVADVIVMDEDGNTVEVTKNPDGTYSYVQPIGKVTINVTFRNKYYPSYPDYDEEKPAEAEDHFRVLCRKLNVRSGAGTQYKRIGSLSRGDCVEGEMLDNGWVKITLEDGTVGYVSGLYVEECEDHDAELPETATVICRKLNVRSGAGTQYRRVGQIGRGEVVSIVDSCNGWYEIAYEDDYAWICAKYVA